MSRTIHGVTMEDDLAWMEDMKGSAWKRFIRQEKTKWDEILSGSKAAVPLFKAQIEIASREAHVMNFRSPSVDIGVGGTLSISWRWRGGRFHKNAATLDSQSGYVWAIEEEGGGAENYLVRLYKGGKSQHIWQHRGVGPFVAVVGTRCYCLEAKNTLVYWRLVSWDSLSGRDYKIHYEERDFRYNLELVRASSCAYLVRQAGPMKDLFLITTGEIQVLEGISLSSRRFVLGSSGEYLVYDGKWRAVGMTGWKLPSFTNAVPEYISKRLGILVTKWYGCRTIWIIREGRPPFTVFRGWATVMPDPWNSSFVRIVRPGAEASWWDAASGTRPSSDSKGIIKMARSADGTEIPYYVLKNGNSQSKSQGLLVIGYGAYGIPTSFMTARWTPLLKQGWAIAIGLWRGGGDHTPEWEDSGRRYGRIKVLDDAEAVVKAARAFTQVPAKRTVLYGRSAGGLWVGGLAAKHPQGDLAGGAYMEMPYLDVLRTTTNRTLPLTNIETDEFGLPEKRLSDFIGMLEWSPMELIGRSREEIPGMWQIIRTAANDSEVFAYESAKWVARSKNAFLAMGDGGHFTDSIETLAEDLSAILHLTLEN